MSICTDLLGFYLVVARCSSVYGNLDDLEYFYYYRCWCIGHPCRCIPCTHASIPEMEWLFGMHLKFLLGPDKSCSKKFASILNWQSFNILKVKGNKF